MIKVVPTTVSGLSHAAYSIDLHATINPHRPRAKKVSTTIDGGVAVSLWRKGVAGATASIRPILHPDVYARLIAIVYHPTVFEWLVIVDGKHYIAELDITADDRVTFRDNPDYHRVGLAFLIIKAL